ncbi:MAG: DUF58 domain-containing protein [Candidatus Muirbacterium halophilum]|nr:DUF58 domain-containing protein [Candidatus Muirbacterium halophilum]MCK9475684.1 DUF58 domain-containing protein [Candidatus Muirbacterium halophilum]
MSFFNPEELYKLKNLKFVADKVVEGFLYGFHKSPYSGVNIEFSEYRPYEFGDELKNIDWKLWGKTDKLYVKKFEEETNMHVWILLDSSKSMKFENSKDISKLFYAKMLSASLAYIFMRQMDVVGMADFSEKIKSVLPASNKGQHFSNLIKFLENIKISGNTDFSYSFLNFSRIMKKRGLIILISDMIDDSENLKKSISYFKHRKNQVIVFHIYDKREKDFPYSREKIFIDSETNERFRVNADNIRENYKEAFKKNQEKIRNICYESGIGYINVSTDDNPVEILNSFFGRRT